MIEAQYSYRYRIDEFHGSVFLSIYYDAVGQYVVEKSTDKGFKATLHTRSAVDYHFREMDYKIDTTGLCGEWIEESRQLYNVDTKQYETEPGYDGNEFLEITRDSMLYNIDGFHYHLSYFLGANSNMMYAVSEPNDYVSSFRIVSVSEDKLVLAGISADWEGELIVYKRK